MSRRKLLLSARIDAIRMAGISLHDAIDMATVNPARAAHIAGRQRGLSPGEKADLIRFRWDAGLHQLAILQTVVAGTTVYCSQPRKTSSC